MLLNRINLAVCLHLMIPAVGFSADWPQWRGRDGQGYLEAAHALRGRADAGLADLDADRVRVDLVAADGRGQLIKETRRKAAAQIS